MSLLRNHVNCSCVSSMENKEELELTWCPQVFGATFLFVVLSSNCFYSGVFPLRVSWQAVWIPSQSLSPHSLLVLWQKRQDVCVFGEFERRHKKMCKTASSEPQEYVKVKNYKIFFFFFNIYRRWREFHWDRGWVRSHTQDQLLPGISTSRLRGHICTMNTLHLPIIIQFCPWI